MKTSQKKGAQKGGKKGADKGEAPIPDKLYRPFETLGKKQKGKGSAGAGSTQTSGSAKMGEGKSTHGGKGSATGGTGAGTGHPAKSTAHRPSPKPDMKSSAKSASPSGSTMSAEDAESFALYMAGVRELSDRATRIPRSANRVEKAAKGALPKLDLDAPAREQLAALVAEGVRFETSDDGERIEGRRVEVEPKEVRRLRRGQYTVDQQLDLHGLHVPEARKAIETFIEKRRKEGDRVVRIIHGKGGHSPRGTSALRGEIAAWLSQGPAKRHVAAFATAPPEEGGAGAILVLLMRPRA
ncbi:MAG: Smr/MutS family protein [Polyangiaceae bacterium]|nr:Smr/MutS family protein [Polyangiaceae bacterium]